MALGTTRRPATSMVTFMVIIMPFMSHINNHFGADSMPVPN